jgi:hypothetical protein
VQRPEGVDISMGYELIDPGSFFWQKTSMFLVLLWARKVNLLVCCVDVPAEDNRPTLLPQPITDLQQTRLVGHLEWHSTMIP